MPLANLYHLKTPEATNERIRRAIEAVIQHNATTEEPFKRWFLNQKAIHSLIGGRKAAIAEYLEAHQQEIAAHHAQYGITLAYNRKPFPITEMVHLPEVPLGVVMQTEVPV